MRDEIEELLDELQRQPRLRAKCLIRINEALSRNGEKPLPRDAPWEEIRSVVTRLNVDLKFS